MLQMQVVSLACADFAVICRWIGGKHFESVAADKKALIFNAAEVD